MGLGPAGREGEVGPSDKMNRETRGRPWLATPSGCRTPPVQLSTGLCRNLRNPWPWDLGGYSFRQTLDNNWTEKMKPYYIFTWLRRETLWNEHVIEFDARFAVFFLSSTFVNWRVPLPTKEGTICWFYSQFSLFTKLLPELQHRVSYFSKFVQCTIYDNRMRFE